MSFGLEPIYALLKEKWSESLKKYDVYVYSFTNDKNLFEISNMLRENGYKVLTELNNRECMVRIESNGVLLPAFKGITLDYTSIPRIKRTITNNNNNINSKDNSNKSKTNFSLNSNVSLKDILISNSSSRKVVKG